MTDNTEQFIKSRGEAIIKAAHLLISTVRCCEHEEKARAAELSLTIELTGGGTEEWVITIARAASSH